VLAAAFLLALQHVRLLFVFGIVANPILCQVLAPMLGRDRKRDQPIANGLFLCAFLAAIVRAFPAPAELPAADHQTEPGVIRDVVRSPAISVKIWVRLLVGRAAEMQALWFVDDA
jgi:hypothetical protein